MRTFSSQVSFVAGLPAGILALVSLAAVGPLLSLAACSNGAAPPPLAKDAGRDSSLPTDSGMPKKDTGSPAPDGRPDTHPVVDAGVDAPVAVDAPPDALAFTVPASWNASYTQPSDTAAAADRAACKFDRGAMPAQTTGSSTALGSSIPIEHIVVLMQENRSFDSYLGHLQTYEATKGIHNTIESAPSNSENPDYPKDQRDGGTPPKDAGAHPWIDAPQLCFFDTAHSWGAAHQEYDKGLNDGFFYANNGMGDTGEDAGGVDAGQLSGERAMWWYDQTDLPFYYDLYSTFAMGDHYHSALLGSTYPNRMYLYSGTSLGLTDNNFPDISAYPTAETPVAISDELAVRGVSFTWYSDLGVPAEEIVYGTVLLSPTMGITQRFGRNPKAPYTQFLADAKAGNLPAVSFVDGNNLNETTTGNDEHPPDEIEQGQQFVWEVVNAVTTSPNWEHTVLFITYDENGGIFDHVPPPPACKPDHRAPLLDGPLDQSQPGAFDRYGFRVPFVAVSPYAKKSFVSHTTYSHTSIIRFIESRFTLPALTARDANEDPFTDVFDWKNPPFMTPPTFKKPTIDEAAVTKCTILLH